MASLLPCAISGRSEGDSTIIDFECVRASAWTLTVAATAAATIIFLIVLLISLLLRFLLCCGLRVLRLGVAFVRVGRSYVPPISNDFSQLLRRCSWEICRLLVPFRNFYESFLGELGHSRHRIRVDLDAGKQICVSPLVNCRRRSTQLNLHPTLHQIGNEFLVRVSGRYHSFGVVGNVVQSYVTGVCVKDSNDLSLRVPVGHICRDELEVENRSGKIPFECQSSNTECHLNLRQLHRDIDMKRFL